MKTLVIGYGNESRRDDGIGWFVAEALAGMNLPHVEIQTLHQLEVELAEDLAGYDRVIFVDAAVPESPLPFQCSRVTPDFQSHAVAHYLTPPDVLSLCKTLYGYEPDAWLFSIRGEDFNFGMELTPSVEQAGREVVERIASLIASPSLHHSNTPTARSSPSHA
jgi:hydrogenase maturation protease